MSVSAQVEIRQATAANHAAMVPLFERFYYEEGFGDAAVGVAANLDQILRRRDAAAFIALDGGEPVGVAAASTSFGLEVGLSAELEDLYVLPDRRGRGIGAALVEAVLAWARALGCHDVEAVLTPRAQAVSGLRTWYGGQGFADTGRRIFERAL